MNIMSIFELLYPYLRKIGLITAKGLKRHYENIGIRMGKHVYFFSSKIFIDEQRPWMIEIGDYTKITKGVTILQHDYSRSVLRRKYGVVIGESKKTTIGNNCFIGLNATILMGAHVGNNCIVGAGAVVSGFFPDDVVISGNPARVLCSIEEFYKKRKEKYIKEAFDTFLEYVKVYSHEPSEQEMGCFWPIFMPKEIDGLRDKRIRTKLSGDEEDEILEHWINEEPIIYNTYIEFKNAAYEYGKNTNMWGKTHGEKDLS